jgi:hypothetical protein
VWEGKNFLVLKKYIHTHTLSKQKGEWSYTHTHTKETKCCRSELITLKLSYCTKVQCFVQITWNLTKQYENYYSVIIISYSQQLLEVRTVWKLRMSTVNSIAWRNTAIIPFHANDSYTQWRMQFSLLYKSLPTSPHGIPPHKTITAIVRTSNHTVDTVKLNCLNMTKYLIFIMCTVLK